MLYAKFAMQWHSLMMNAISKLLPRPTDPILNSVKDLVNPMGYPTRNLSTLEQLNRINAINQNNNITKKSNE